MLKSAHGKFGRRSESGAHVYLVGGQSSHPATRTALDPYRSIQRVTESHQGRNQEGQRKSKLGRRKLCRKNLYNLTGTDERTSPSDSRDGSSYQRLRYGTLRLSSSYGRSD